MLTQFYPLSFLLCLGALTGWFYYREDKLKATPLRFLFFLSLIVFGAFWLTADYELGIKVKVLLRELTILSVVPLFLSFFRKNKIAFVALLFALLGGLDYFYFDSLKATFVDNNVNTSNNDISINATEDGEILIGLERGKGVSSLSNLVSKFDLKLVPAFAPKDKDITDLDDCYLVDVPIDRMQEISAIQAALIDHPAVNWVEINERIAIEPIELLQKKRPETELKFGLNDPMVADLWGFEYMNMKAYFDQLKLYEPKKTAIVAVLDTGVDANHEDLKSNFNSINAKYDSDGNGHGTHCAGIIAAVSNNNMGVASFSHNNEHVKVTSVKVLSSLGIGTQEKIIDGIIEASDSGVDVISISLGGLSNDIAQEAFTRAVDYANKKKVIVVVAAGNSNDNATKYAPANTPGVITVAAVDTILQKANFSNTIQDIEMGIAAPGVNILSTFPKDKYQFLSGTSMAAPYVAGLVGVIKSLNPSVTTSEVYKILNDTAEATKSGEEGGNFIQPAMAISRLLQNTPVQ